METSYVEYRHAIRAARFRQVPMLGFLLLPFAASDILLHLKLCIGDIDERTYSRKSHADHYRRLGD